MSVFTLQRVETVDEGVILEAMDGNANILNAVTGAVILEVT